MFGNRLLTIIFLLLLSASPTSFAASTETKVEGNQTDTATQNTPASSLKADITSPKKYRLYWESTSLLQHTFSDNEHSLWSLLTFEYHLGTERLSSLYQKGREHIVNAHETQEGERFGKYHEIISTLLILLTAAAVFSIVHRLAKRSTGLLLNISDLIAKKAPKQAWVKSITRLLTSAAPLAPWLLLWGILSIFTTWFSQGSVALLHWWAPLAELYIIYGLLCLTAEWLLLRITSTAGVFLSSEQNKELIAHARRQSAWIIWPWVTLYFIHHLIGPSIVYHLGEVWAWITAWFATAALIKARQADFLENLNQLLPEKLQPLLKPVTSEWLFLFVAILLLPLQLMQFIFKYFDQSLIDFDWYRRLSARWFRMRTKVLSEQSTEDTVEEDVPQQYEQWFSPVGDDDKKFPIISTGLLEALRKPVDSWLTDRTDENALVLTGEKGIGKTAALSRLIESLNESDPEVVIHCTTIPPKTTKQEDVYKLIGDLIDIDLSEGPGVLARTDEERPPTVVILDEAQNLFLADVEDLEGWRSLLSLTNVRLENLFWIVSINNQSWAYLCNVFGREYQIRNAIYAKRWSQNEVRSLILSRNHLSGYKLRYDDILLSSHGSETGNLRNAEQRYFSLLWDSCRGVPMTALGMWLTSVRPVGRTVNVGLPQIPDGSVLEKLGSKLMFVYAAIVTHENLTFEEILRTTNLQENVVRYALKSALDAEFLERSKDGRYRIASLWYQTVINYLARKNMLNE